MYPLPFKQGTWAVSLFLIPSMKPWLARHTISTGHINIHNMHVPCIATIYQVGEQDQDEALLYAMFGSNKSGP